MAKELIAVEDFQIAEEFLATLRRSLSRWSDTDNLQVDWVFRGQWKDYELLPSAFRDNEWNSTTTLLGRKISQLDHDPRWTHGVLTDLAAPAITKPDDLPQTEWDDRMRMATLHCAAHASLIRDFVLVAQRAGQAIEFPDYLHHLFAPADPPTAKSFMTRFFNGIDLRTAEAHPKIDPIFAIAQHHGVPTALMDWTRNPLIAAYFAAERVTKQTPEKGQNICIYAMHRAAYRGPDYRGLKRLKAITVPPLVVRFLDAQEGLFTWCPIAYHTLLETGSYPTLDDILHKEADVLPKPSLIKLTLPQDQADDLLKLLWREHVTLAHLMPTFDHVRESLMVQSLWYQ